MKHYHRRYKHSNCGCGCGSRVRASVVRIEGVRLDVVPAAKFDLLLSSEENILMVTEDGKTFIDMIYYGD
ncbi:MAG: hypothetical protein LBS55_02185 [Prevotellaceae bacterium]|nr:hypothetical protein [Prevotellaceae bacterium]